MPEDEYDLAPDPVTAPPRKPGAAARPRAEAEPSPPRQNPQTAGGFVRDGRVVVNDGASLPDRCISCNAPAGDGRVTKRFAYNFDDSKPGAARLVPLFGRIVWLVWLIGQMSSRQYLTVSYCVCKRHRVQRIVATIVMTLAMLAGAILVIVGFRNTDLGTHGRGIDTTPIIAGVVLFFFGALCGFAIKSLQIAVVRSRGAELKGAGKPFMDSMPKLTKKFIPGIR